MKRNILISIGITLTTLYGVLSWGIVAHSEPIGPDESVYGINKCSSDDGLNHMMCCIDYNEAMDAVKRDWDTSLQALIDQEIPASEMVADAYESMRTYNCWLEYICRAVEFSGRAPLASVKPSTNIEGGTPISTGLTSKHIGIVPGCQKPEDMKMEKEWDSFINKMASTPIIGQPMETLGDYYVSEKMNFFPRCMTDTNNQSPSLPIVNRNYNKCKEALEFRFSCKAGDNDPSCTNKSNAFVKIDNILKKKNADQKASAIENKLGDIVPKLQTMEIHVGYMSNFLQQLNSRLACFAAKCT